MLITLDDICHISTCEHQACKETGGCTGVEWRAKHAAANLHRRAAELLADAGEWGFVITIEQRSIPPLAMGHYEHVVTVRKARNA